MMAGLSIFAQAGEGEGEGEVGRRVCAEAGVGVRQQRYLKSAGPGMPAPVKEGKAPKAAGSQAVGVGVRQQRFLKRRDRRQRASA
ncbi:hypothetical protein J2S03_002549 [Alicyclobacillus cycloheptanicus]|uniref:Uncharacterized protein n=1 Tax=Alicyclobacillus cycloheptanicus TaxID=1457 RepID=A0ABT9XKD1_9BACL|nr:hypothetical protein [Alicyclobacillus cycloheptanicus]